MNTNKNKLLYTKCMSWVNLLHDKTLVRLEMEVGKGKWDETIDERYGKPQ